MTGKLSKVWKSFGFVLAAAMLIAACQPAVSASTAGATPSPSASSTPSGPTATPLFTGPSTVNVSLDPNLGSILVDAKGMTLYTYKNDTPGVSNCTGSCAQIWPPFLFSGQGSPTAGFDVFGKVGLISLPDGSQQVTYNGMPLYHYSGDKQPGDTTGQGIGGVWFAAKM